MPQLNKGGKYVFGFSEIRNDLTIQLPRQAISEYNITLDGSVILITGSKSTGGFCVTNERLLKTSKLKHILAECTDLATHTLPQYEFVRFKGRGYSWAAISLNGILQLFPTALEYLNLSIGNQLISIRSSNIAFVMGARGPLLERAHFYKGAIEHY